MNIKFFGFGLFSFGFALGAPALFVQPAFSQQASAPANEVTSPISKLYAALKKIQADKNASFEQKESILTPVITQVFDLPDILRISVGYKYESFSPADKQKLLAIFTKFTVARYISSFSSDDSPATFTISPKVSPASNGGQTVSTNISDTQINYLMRKNTQGWKISDVLVDGHISQVALQHGDFRSALGNGEGNVDNLIANLNKKIEQFSNN